MENVMFEGEYWFHSSLWNAETTMSLKLSARSRYKNLNLISLWGFFYSWQDSTNSFETLFLKKIVQISQHFVLFLIEIQKKKKIVEIIVQRHNTLQPYKSVALFWYSAWKASPPVFFSFALFCFVFCFSAGSLWGVCSLFGAQSQNGRVSDCRGPHRLLPDISVPSLVGDTKWNLWMALQVSGQVFMGFYGSSSVRQRAEASS